MPEKVATANQNTTWPGTAGVFATLVGEFRFNALGSRKRTESHPQVSIRDGEVSSLSYLPSCSLFHAGDAL
jgi:hypothetical protein